MIKEICLVAVLLISITCTVAAAPAEGGAPGRPNVVIVITDDQGYGDLGCHGNEIIKTPNLDRLHSQSTRLTNFHVSPTCAPTRSALMTGRYANATGVWHTIMGRSILRRDEATIGRVFADAGYATAMFGKWHLGDNFPSRPEDMGFQHVVRHGGGGVGQLPDVWGNDYFDDTYCGQRGEEKIRRLLHRYLVLGGAEVYRRECEKEGGRGETFPRLPEHDARTGRFMSRTSIARCMRAIPRFPMRRSTG